MVAPCVSSPSEQVCPTVTPSPLLTQVTEFLFSKSWDLRMTVSKLLGELCAVVKFHLPQFRRRTVGRQTRGSGGGEGLTLLKFSDLNISVLLEEGSELGAADFGEEDSVPEMVTGNDSSAALIVRQRRQVLRRLGGWTVRFVRFL